MKSEPYLRTTLAGGVMAAVAIGLIGGGIGWAVAGVPGLLGGLIGALLGLVVMALTAVGAIIGGRVGNGELLSGGFLAVFLGTMAAKFVLFIVVVIWLHEQHWVDQLVLFLSMIIAILASLIVDVVAMLRSRIPYVDVELPQLDGDDSRV